MTVHADRALVVSPEGRRLIAANLPAALPEGRRKRILELADTSIEAIRGGDGPTAKRAAEEAQRLLATAQGGRALGEHWAGCASGCDHHLRHPTVGSQYSVCFWACVIRGRDPSIPGW